MGVGRKVGKLNLRTFDDDEKRGAYERQTADAKAQGVSNCPECAKRGLADVYDYEEMEGDHVVPWSKGGKTVPENLQPNGVIPKRRIPKERSSFPSGGCEIS